MSQTDVTNNSIIIYLKKSGIDKLEQLEEFDSIFKPIKMFNRFVLIRFYLHRILRNSNPKHYRIPAMRKKNTVKVVQ